MTTEKHKMILLHAADDNAIIICNSEEILWIAPSLISPAVTTVRFALPGVDLCHLDVRETPEEIAFLANWEIKT